MTQKNYLFTSESVTEGHPDKVADQISDAILDEFLRQDKKARVACETLVTTGLVMVAGEVTANAVVDISATVRKTVGEIGYTHPGMGFEANSCSVVVSLDKQSPDICQGVTEGQGLFKEQGAGDQGIMFGFACDETKELMPMPIQFAHEISQRLAAVRKDGTVNFLRPDGKSQVTVEYADGKPRRVHTVVVSTQHEPGIPHSRIEEAVTEEVIKKIIPSDLRDAKTRYFINPTGNFVVGGPMGDCGLTGRKIIVDTYGGYAPHGGGAFSGKDPSKVDRSACYMARYIAKNVVAAGLAKKCLIQVAYAIGYAEPISLLVETYGTERTASEKIEGAIREFFPLKPAGLIEHLKLLRPIYRQTAAYGHFGREEENFTWERTDLVDALKRAV